MEKFCARLDSLLVPYELTPINGLGMCCLSQGSYTIFRLIITALSIANLSYIACLIPTRALLQFTIWGLLISVFCTIFLLMENLIIYFSPKSQIWKLSHFLFNLTLIYQLFIFGVYWCGIFPYSMITSWGESTPVQYSLYITQHAIPIILLTIDFFINPIVLWNFIHIPFYIALLAVYICVNCVYTLRIGDVYEGINFKNALTYGFLAGCVGAILFCHVLIRLMSMWCKEERVKWMIGEMRKRSGEVKGKDNRQVTPYVNAPSRANVMQDVITYKQVSMPTIITATNLEPIKIYFKQNHFQ